MYISMLKHLIFFEYFTNFFNLFDRQWIEKIMKNSEMPSDNRFNLSPDIYIPLIIFACFNNNNNLFKKIIL